MAGRGRRKRRHSSASTNTNDSSKKNDGRARENNASEDRKEADDKEVYILDGVEYKNYNDFVTAKRQRNEKYLRELGFDKKTKTKNKGRSSNTHPKKTGNEASAETATTSKKGQAKMVSPASCYYERYADDGSTFGVSLDGASLDTDPFNEISNLLLGLEREQQKTLSISSLGAIDTPPVIVVRGNKRTTELQGNPTTVTRDEPARKVSTPASKQSRVFIGSLLKKLLSFLSPAPMASNVSVREKYLVGFHELKGVALILRLLIHYQDEKEDDCSSTSTTSTNIVILCLQILRDACCLSMVPANRDSVAEKLALDLIHQSGLEILQSIVISLKDVVKFGTSRGGMKSPAPSKFKRGISKGCSVNVATRSNLLSPANASQNGQNNKSVSKAKQENILQVTRNAWSVYGNLTYFESVTTVIGKRDLLELADLAYWTVTALDCHVTESLEAMLKSTNKNSTQPIIISPEAMENSKIIATEASRILEPVLGTIRNLVADPIATTLDWNSKCLVSRLLDVLCKGDEERDNPSTTEKSAQSNENDWLHFVTQIFHSSTEESPTIAAVDVPPTNVFRWMEHSESVVWELLGIFKVCLGKGILSTFSNDVERLVMLWIRCLRRFGVSSNRITLRILILVESLIFPSATMKIVYGEMSSSTEIRKKILLREGFLNELLDLSGRFSCLGGCGRLPVNGETVRTKIESMITRLRD